MSLERALEGKAAIVTGAAQGLGRVEALELARLGARVVVNDLDKDGAHAVAEEIRAVGGEALVHVGDVADWNASRKLVETATEKLGDLHILVNNAGFLRDRMIFSMSEEEFDSVVRVHLKGHFCTMHFASAYWRDTSKARGEPVYGRLISTSSEAAIVGSPGQPNYSAAKAGIIALTMGAAQALAKYGVSANVILPRARTAMTNQGPTAPIFAKPEEGFDTFAPENVAPCVAYLCTPQAERISGHLFLIWGKQVTVLQRPTRGECFKSDEAWTVGSLHQALAPHFEKLEPVKDGFIFPLA